jgi:hypothetical protein
LNFRSGADSMAFRTVSIVFFSAVRDTPCSADGATRLLQ